MSQGSEHSPFSPLEQELAKEIEATGHLNLEDYIKIIGRFPEDRPLTTQGDWLATHSLKLFYQALEAWLSYLVLDICPHLPSETIYREKVYNDFEGHALSSKARLELAREIRRLTQIGDDFSSPAHTNLCTNK